MNRPINLRIVALSLTSLVLAATPASAAIVASDVTNYWKLDGDLTDSVGGSDGIFSSGSPTYTTGFDGTVGGAVDFSGTIAYVTTTLTVATGAKSMSLFFSVTTSGTFDAMAGVGAGQRFYVAHRGDTPPGVAEGVISSALGNGGAAGNKLPSADYSPTGTDVALGTFHHVVLVDNGDGTATSYYRSPSDPGHLVASFSYTGTAGGLGSFNIGTIDGAASLAMDGVVDDVALFNRALTLGEVESIWDAGSVAAAIPEPSTIALLALAGLTCLRSRRK